MLIYYINNKLTSRNNVVLGDNLDLLVLTPLAIMINGNF